MRSPGDSAAVAAALIVSTAFGCFFGRPASLLQPICESLCKQEQRQQSEQHGPSPPTRSAPPRLLLLLLTQRHQALLLQVFS